LDLHYRELVDQNSPDIIERQEQTIQRYTDKLEKYQEANLRLESRVRVRKANRAFETLDGQIKVEQRAGDLRAEIDRVLGEIADIETQISEVNKTHRTEMTALKKKMRCQVTAGAPVK
jgi:predicted  nucleic acid-binding Zn-ribbon protein